MKSRVKSKQFFQMSGHSFFYLFLLRNGVDLKLACWHIAFQKIEVFSIYPILISSMFIFTKSKQIMLESCGLNQNVDFFVKVYCFLLG